MTSSLPESLEGKLVADSEARYAIVASRFNEFVVEELVRGAQNGLLRHGAKAEKITVVRVPGAFEIPQVARRLAKSGKFDAIITCGAVIRGSTAHFDYVAGQAASGLASVSLETNVPVVFGILTTDTIEQAIERAGTKAGNKGFDAALTAIEMLSLGKTLSSYGI